MPIFPVVHMKQLKMYSFQQYIRWVSVSGLWLTGATVFKILDSCLEVNASEFLFVHFSRIFVLCPDKYCLFTDLSHFISCQNLIFDKKKT